MGRVECPREQDVLDALASGRWPSRCPEDLRGHVAGCAICADLVAVAGPLMEAASVEWESVRVPAPGTVWWRAQLRARREAARQAERPVTVAQVFGWVTAAVALAAFAWAAAPLLAGLAPMLPELPALPSLPIPSLPEPASLAGALDFEHWRLVAAAMVAWLVLAPLVIYFAILED